ncbi:MAG: response regulator [bacterium]|nr:response regulator [bacterium]
MLKILLVEDDAGDRRLLQLSLNELSPEMEFAVTSAETMADALEYLREELIHLIFLDLGLPDSQGIDSIITICTSFPEIPVIVMTGFDDIRTGVQSIKNGASDFLVKGKTGKDMLYRAIRYSIERKQSGAALRESEEKLRSTLRSMDDLVFALDKEGVFLDYHQPENSKLYVPPEAFVGKSFREVLPPNIVESLESAIDDVVNMNQIIQFDYSIVIDEEVNWFTAKVSMRKDINGEYTGVTVVARDITEGKQTEEALKQSRLQFHTLASNIPGIIHRCLLDKDWTMLFMSSAVSEICGYPASDFINNSVRTYESIIHREDTEYVDRSVNEAVESGKPWEIEYRICHKEGGIRTVYEKGIAVTGEKGTVEFLDGFIFDITDRKQIELALHRSEEKYRLITETASVGIFSTDIRGYYTFSNNGHTQMLGFTREEIIGMNFTSILTKSTLEEGREIFKKVLAGETISGEMVIRRKDGHEFPVSFDAVPIIKNNEVIGITGFAQNITGRKQAEKKIKQAKEAAETANRAKSEFLANMSHELRTPLNAIIGFSQILEMKEKGEYIEKQPEYLKYISESGKHLLDMVNDILDLAKIESGNIEIEKMPFDFISMLKRAPDSVKAMAVRKKIRIDMNIDEDVGWLNGDEVRIKQVLFNLLSNAVKFTDDGKRIGIESGTEGDTIITTVWDEGRGIHEDDIERIFNPFEQVKGGIMNLEGTGLGLAISKRLIKHHGGTLSVESTYGEGSRFTIILPERLDISGKKNPEKRMPETLKTEPIKDINILVVEDNEMNMTLIKEALSPLYTVDTAVTGRDAVERARGKTYDIVLMDIQLPGMNGIEAMKKIREFQKKQVHIIALTAYAMKGDDEKYLEAGFDDYLSKPVNLSLLMEKIEG